MFCEERPKSATSGHRLITEPNAINGEIKIDLQKSSSPGQSQNMCSSEAGACLHLSLGFTPGLNFACLTFVQYMIQYPFLLSLSFYIYAQEPAKYYLSS